ncbi:response regulator [Microcoleus sp. LEGE 07076]|uniref:response regulator n=1 Tax=Microcoleus sp. LEGE 07076 TaxID=915322 RepID=UPI001880C347|nr:response regulator [Microcoleus sp. LEGE 07076]MBE9185771.1 response regulator [Microcoleus sp. LEGE 07076]
MSSIANQLRYGFVSIVVASVLMAGSTLAYLSFRGQIEQTKQLQFERSQATAIQISAYLDNLQRQLNYLSELRGLTEFNAETQRSILEGLVNSNSAYEVVGIFNSKGQIIQAISPYEPFSVSSLSLAGISADAPIFWQTIKQGQNYVNQVEVDMKTKVNVVNLAVPVRDSKNKIAGVLFARVSLNFLIQIVARSQVGKTGYSYVLDHRSVLISETGSKINPYLLQDLRGRSFVGELFKLALASGMQSPIVYRGWRGEEVMGTGAIVRPVQWMVVVELPTAEAYAPVRSLVAVMGAVTIASALAAAGLGVALARSIANPLKIITSAATKMTSGMLETRVNIAASNELEKLANAFNSMASQLQISFTKLEDQNAQLQRLDKLKDEFLANTSHELRTPLNGIIGLTESLIDGATGQLPEPTISNLEIIAFSGRRLSNLINDILDFSKLRHKNIELQIKPVGIREIVDIVVTLSQPLIGTKNLQLINSVTADIPLVDADENRVQQILYNLIGNAIKFTDTGTVEISANTICLNLPELGDRESSVRSQLQSLIIRSKLQITVSDSGIGIAEDKLERIFEFFEQADGSTAREYGGSGLGLAITKQLVELHGGAINVFSELGIGSQFTFSLPISQNQCIERNQLSSTVRQSLVSTTNQRHLITNETVGTSFNNNSSIAQLVRQENTQKKILIVDDEPVNIQVLVNNLLRENYALAEASSGKEALAFLDTGYKPDLVLLDIMMPRMTGYEVCEKIREKFTASEVPIVMLTAKNQVSDLVQGFNAGANDFLTKPFVKNELLARIKTHIRLAKINAAYGKFVPHDFLRFLGRESIVDVQLGDQIQKEMAVLFSDIRSFTTISEAMTPQENFKFINSYLSRVSPVIRAHQGFIDKYIGDAIMALFPESADDAVRAAVEMQKQVIVYNQHRQRSNYAPIAIGIGLHAGTLMLGTIGEQERMESTVIADAVNLASRLEGLTKVYGSGILVAESILERLGDREQYLYRFVDRVTVKGKKLAVSVFEIYNGETQQSIELKQETAAAFEKGLELYFEQNFTKAQKIFKKICETNPQDKLAAIYCERSLKNRMYGVPEGWSGIEALDDK